MAISPRTSSTTRRRTSRACSRHGSGCFATGSSTAGSSPRRSPRRAASSRSARGSSWRGTTASGSRSRSRASAASPPTPPSARRCWARGPARRSRWTRRAAAGERGSCPSGVARRLAPVRAVSVAGVETLEEYAAATASCTRCRLAQGRTQVVFGAGNPRADLMFVGEAPGFHEDKQGVPFVGQAGKLLDGLLAGIGITRDDVFVANVLKCRPPGNRDPQQDEIESCEPHLFRQIELIEPKVIATLGNFATKLLSGRPLGITRVHGQEQELTIAGRSVLLFPLYHPAAALYTPAMLKVLEADFARLPELMGRGMQPAVVAVPEPEPEPAVEAPAEQLGLF